MLNDAETAAGCLAYYFEELQRVGKRETEKNAERNFRRGVLFGYKLKRKGIIPAEALEMGPGSGYFAAGLRFVFPALKMTVMDVNAEVLAPIRSTHGFLTLEGVPERFVESCESRFDLVIARDLLEHVADVPAAIRNIVRYLVPGGLFHFITPNGQEDVWKHYLAAKMAGRPSELLINHVNYFDGNSLRKLLERNGLSAVEYYTYGIKRTLRGNGWKSSTKLMAGLSRGKRVDEQLNSIHNDSSGPFPLKKWYIIPKRPRLTWLYCLWHHHEILRLPPEANVGHEIWGIFRK
ncbi:MAG TPA: class I SAM-dependent methyltransferase [Bacteroidales bacterium]|nr:class I SAM-dependent methyltransferase [Bacteroidales bacterium]